MMRTRRQFLRAAAGCLGIVGLSATVSAAGDYPERPDHITASDDEAELKQYEPALHASYTTRQEMQALYGWKAESDNYQTDAYYYWMKYPSQASVWQDWFGFDGQWFGSKDAHLTDHEPVIMFADADTGEVDTVVYSSGHHYADELSADEANLTQDRRSDSSHVNLAVDPTHHHYNDEQEGDGAFASEFLGGTDRDIKSWLDARQAWYDNDVFAKSSEDAVEDPWAARDRGMWWAEGTKDARLKGIYQTLGLGGAGDVTRDL